MAAAISSVGSAIRVNESVPCQCSAVLSCQPKPRPLLNASLNAPKPAPMDDIIEAAGVDQRTARAEVDRRGYVVGQREGLGLRCVRQVSTGGLGP